MKFRNFVISILLNSHKYSSWFSQSGLISHGSPCTLRPSHGVCASLARRRWCNMVHGFVRRRYKWATSEQDPHTREQQKTTAEENKTPESDKKKMEKEEREKKDTKNDWDIYINFTAAEFRIRIQMDYMHIHTNAHSPHSRNFTLPKTRESTFHFTYRLRVSLFVLHTAAWDVSRINMCIRAPHISTTSGRPSAR